MNLSPKMEDDIAALASRMLAAAHDGSGSINTLLLAFAAADLVASNFSCLPDAAKSDGTRMFIERFALSMNMGNAAEATPGPEVH